MQGSVQNVARRLGKCRSYRRMQIHCMVLIVVSRYVSPARACYGAVCAECALAGAVSVHLHLIIPSPHSGLQLERESHCHDSYPQVSRGMGASSTLDIIN